jgi:hypothetical protein
MYQLYLVPSLKKAIPSKLKQPVISRDSQSTKMIPLKKSGIGTPTPLSFYDF